MPTLKYRRHHRATLPLPDSLLRFLRDELGEPDDEARYWEFGEYGDRAREVWDELGREIVERWAREHPGARPSSWWRWSAPAPRPEHEDEFTYLQRLGLLLPGEAKKVRR